MTTRISRIICFSALALALSGCMNPTNERLDHMDAQMDRIAGQVETDQQYVQTATDHMKAMDDNSSRIAKETETYEASIKSLAEQLKRIADSMADFQKMGNSAMDILKNAFKPAPPAPTPDIDDILKK